MSEKHFYIRVNGTLWSVSGGGYPPKNHFLIAQPLEEHSGWAPASYVSNSGKSMFVCKTCGRHSQTPDRHCPIGQTINLTEFLVVDPIKFTRR